MKIKLLAASILLSGLLTAHAGPAPYADNWDSLKNYHAPEWFEDAKLGFWVHWGVYSVPAFNGQHAAEWYGRWMYGQKNQTLDNVAEPFHEHHLAMYGDPAKFGYKDFIPMWKAEKFDANHWADLCVAGGAKFFCMMATHHDTFCLWDTKLSKWNSVAMGPHRDLVGEISRAVRAKGLKFGVSNHSGFNYHFFYLNHLNDGDARDPANQDLYGNPIIDKDALRKIFWQPGEKKPEFYAKLEGKILPSTRDLDRWLARTEELADLYQPDLYYFDWGMNRPEFESRRQEFGAHYYNQAIAWGKGTVGRPGVVLTYKEHAFPDGSAVRDYERGAAKQIEPHVWQTDDSVFGGNSWGYAPDIKVKSANTIIDHFVDIISKRGVLMLSFAPKADGTFPEDQQLLLHNFGGWMKINGEAIYATRPWVTFGSDADKVTKTPSVRFTRSKDKQTLYAILRDWPTGEILLKDVTAKTLPPATIKTIQFLGTDQPLKWTMTPAGLTIPLPATKPAYDYAFPIRIQLSEPMAIAD